MRAPARSYVNVRRNMNILKMRRPLRIVTEFEEGCIARLNCSDTENEEGYVKKYWIWGGMCSGTLQRNLISKGNMTCTLPERDPNWVKEASNSVLNMRRAPLPLSLQDTLNFSTEFEVWASFSVLNLRQFFYWLLARSRDFNTSNFSSWSA